MAKKTATTTDAGVGSILGDFCAKYDKTTPKKIKLIDGFLAYVLATGILQFIYCMLVGNFPFNSFLAGFVCTVGVFVLAGACKLYLVMKIVIVTYIFLLCVVSLRMQINPENSFDGRTEQRAFADYLFCNIILFLVVFNFMG
ncbi:Dolichyl-diphosphooligosaccharide--protein glycosyltransferase subunit DAD1 [Phytophthora citrophthora]|uniref:Dolichyl-diphosphooligosaccharide--protein glycosyltransferase subunit OST2 n=1 Tax=Phytophthora citrophthora TaxID=4793 RepID=A0AAD9LPA0_9STRA|nr:Dolichyl-diphosphooligosaccharide--protein glycosyltransferase subunit DAD1 [Phytophthora citrophthora]